MFYNLTSSERKIAMARYSEQQKAVLDALMKDNVYEKAIAIMTCEDPQELTMERLAKDVGVSRGTLYNYFADRDAVVDFVVDRTFEPLKQAVGQLADGDLPPREQLTKIVEWVFSTVFEDRALVVALAPAKQPYCRRGAYRARHLAFVNAIEKVIRNGIACGAFRDLDPPLVSEIVFGAVRGTADAMVESGEFLPPERVVPIFNGLLVGGLCNSELEATDPR
jgi:AcrR family transcriptional regulator